MVNSLSHRGPDDSGEYFSERDDVALGHRRLSIIDLSSAGHQPMSNEDKTFWLTFNGEIYNFQGIRDELVRKGHTFKSNTDSEVILHSYEEWGAKCLNRFNGMFAFGLWDETKEQLFLARDRVGIKPLYYTRLNGSFIFGSEPKAIIASDKYKREMDSPALADFLIYRYISGEKSIWKGLKKLLPGQYLIYDRKEDSTNIFRYWRLALANTEITETEAIERLDHLLRESVKRRWVSDVPVGIFLSGGLDSTAVTKYSTDIKGDVDTFTIGFANYADNENEDARLVSEIFGANYYEEYLSVSEAGNIEELFKYYDEPIGDSSILPTFLVSKVARKKVKVILSGDGGDETLGGYRWYTDFYKYYNFMPSLAWFFKMLAQVRYRNLGERFLSLSIKDDAALYRQLTSPRFSLAEIKDLFPASSQDLPEDENYLINEHLSTCQDRYKRFCNLDFHTFLVDDILTKVDRASMANSLEVRVPFLDYTVVEFLFSLPDSLVLKNGEKKYLLKQLLKKFVPAKIINKPKKGFSCPLIGQYLRPEVLAKLLNGRMAKDGFVVREKLQNLIENIHSGNNPAKLWLMLVLEIWYKKWYCNE